MQILFLELDPYGTRANFSNPHLKKFTVISRPGSNTTVQYSVNH